jgi:uncharacterized protein YqeY
MTALKDKLTADLNSALKARDEVRVSTLRFLLAYLHNLEIAKPAEGEARQGRQKELEDEEIIGAIQKQVKDHEESIAAFKQGQRQDLVEKEEKELEILRSYLPTQLTLEELEVIVDQAIEEGGFAGLASFGKVMGQVMGKVKGRAAGEEVARIVKASLA